MIKKKLFLLDAMALIYRAFYALNKNPRYTSSGINTSAIVGFVNTIVELLKTEKPDYIGIAFDTQAPTVRHEEFLEYKANREAMPDDLSVAIPYIKRFIEAMNIPILFVDGFEADDIIGTLAKKAEKKDLSVFMMTPDKDFGQLVSENIKIYKPAKFGNPAEVIGVEEICKKYNIKRPDQVIDILGIWGDASDNIPGITGIGEVGAKKLIEEFDNLENIIANASEIKNQKIKEKVLKFSNQALLSKKLATIITDVPIKLDVESLKISKPNLDGIKNLFTELEFKTILDRFLKDFSDPISTNTNNKKVNTSIQTNLFDDVDFVEGESNTAENHSQYSNINTIQHQYYLVDSINKIEELIKYLKKQKTICFDTETTGLDVISDQIVGISFCSEPHLAYYVQMPEDFEECCRIIQLLNVVFEDDSIEKVAQNIKFDQGILNRYGLELNGQIFDTMIAHYLLQPDARHNLDYLANTYLNYEPISFDNLLGKKGKIIGNIKSVEIDKLVDYACEDADITLQLKNIFQQRILEENLIDIFQNVEIPLIDVLLTMEKNGVNISATNLNEYSKQLEKEIFDVENDIYTLAETQFNIASPQQLGQILFDKLKISDNAKLTKTKQYATGEEILTKLIHKHPIINKILEYRSLSKLKSTYVDTLPVLIHKKTGRVHTSYNQAVAATGRLSSNNPNLQNIPIRTEKGREIRKAFIPKNDDYVIVSADYSQIELRIIASLSKDETMIEAFKNNQDIHSATAANVYNVSIDEVTKEMRRNAKTVNFGIIYGISSYGLSERINIPRKEAADLIEQYFIKFPGIKKYMETTIDFARKYGYVTTLLGRKRFIKDINSRNETIKGYAERNAINAPIQGSAADMIKIAMINIQQQFIIHELKSEMVMQVHDELVFDVNKLEIPKVFLIVETEMKNALPLDVPIEIEISQGNNWLEAH